MIIRTEIFADFKKHPVMPTIMPRYLCVQIWRRTKKLNDNYLNKNYGGAA